MEIAGVLAVVAFDEAGARDRPNGRRIELPRPEEVVATTDEQIQAKQRSAASRLILVMTIIIGLIQLIATSRKPRSRSSGDNRPESIS